MAQITATLEHNTRVSLSNGRHAWSADEPQAAGGDDTGPNPYELLLASLAACTCITLALYARHKGIELAGIAMTIDYDKVHADDCAECDDDASGYIDRISSQVRIAGDFDPAQRKRLTQIVARCPVHKTLERGIVLSENVEFSG